MAFHHVSVMSEEVIDALNINPDGTYVDATLGGGGHSLAIARKLSDHGRLIGIDQDDAAIQAATERLAGVSCSLRLERVNFAHLDDVLKNDKAPAVDGILFDLGVSSHQIDTAERGFSYMHDAPLDMRMDRRKNISACDLVNSLPAADLAQLFYEYGEERYAKRIARAIESARREAPVTRTLELVSIIDKAIPQSAKYKIHGHSAKRVFQALRIAVNNELDILPAAIRSAVGHLKPGGRLAVITFHSLEDALVKRTLKELAVSCVCPPDMPVCVCGHKADIKILGRPLKPTVEETERNSRARSAKLRTAEKL